MTLSTILKTVYASAPDDIVRIQAIIVELPTETVRLVNAYAEMELGVNGVMQTFEPCGMDIELPTKDDSGNQTLNFALGILDDDRVNGLVEAALEAATPVYLEYREYLSADLLTPALAPIRMTVNGGVFASGELGLEGSYMDILNTRWPRESYTIALAPGLKWM